MQLAIDLLLVALHLNLIYARMNRTKRTSHCQLSLCTWPLVLLGPPRQRSGLRDEDASMNIPHRTQQDSPVVYASQSHA